MIGLLLYIIILCLVAGVALYVVRTLPLDPPFGRIAQVVIAVLFAICLIYLLLEAVPYGAAPRRLP